MAMVKKRNKKKSSLLTPFAAGIFLGVALFDALPESLDTLGWPALLWMALGAVLWWVQKLIAHALQKKSLPALTATALWSHSLVEGLAAGLAFGISNTFGIAVLIGMVLHLLPEFFAAVAIMRGAGSERRTSVWVTFIGYAVLFATFAATYFYLPNLGNTVPIMAATSGGAFLYVSYRILRKYRTAAPFVAASVGAIMSILFTLL